GPPDQGGAVGRGLEPEMEGRDRPRVAGPEADGRLLLDLAAATDDRLRRAADERAGPEHRAHGPGGVLERARMGRGDEEDREVGRSGTGPETLEHLARDLADGGRGDGVL